MRRAVVVALLSTSAVAGSRQRLDGLRDLLGYDRRRVGHCPLCDGEEGW